MRPLIRQITTALSPESLVERLQGEPGIVLLRSALFDSPEARYSFVTVRPFLTFRSFGSRCEITFHVSRFTFHPIVAPKSDEGGLRITHPASRITPHVQFGNPWHLLDSLMSRFELLDEVDLPFPLGGCFGYWGYDLKNFVEPKLPRRAVNDLELPDCHVGFYSDLVVFDHRLDKTWIVSMGLDADGSRSELCAVERLEFWTALLIEDLRGPLTPNRLGAAPLPAWHEPEVDLCGSRLDAPKHRGGDGPSPQHHLKKTTLPGRAVPAPGPSVTSNLSQSDFVARVQRIRSFIHAGDIYQANLSHRLSTGLHCSAWDLFQELSAVSPAPFSAYLDCGDFQIASSSPELFLRLTGPHIMTRPIKGTRPRSADPTRDAQFTYELQTSAKEMAELVMITDLLRNDLGRVCEFGSVHVPELVRLERYPQVQHLVSTVEGRLRSEVTHFSAFASCFPGGSITGAPKFRAMEIIDKLEPVARGPYTGALGYLGFNRESQLSILIRAAVCKERTVYFPVGAGIVADSNPEAEYEETLAKAAGFFASLQLRSPGSHPSQAPPDRHSHCP